MLEKMKGTVDERMLKQSFLFTAVLGLVAHGYCFLNLLVSHDSLNDFYVSDKWERAGFGRIFYSIYLSFTRGRIVLPWLIGILTLCWIGIAVYLVVKMFGIKKTALIFLVAGIFVTNPTVYTLTATYIHDLDADMLAMLFSVVSVYVWGIAINTADKRNKLLWLLCGSVLLSVSLGIYQSFISLTIVLVIVDSLKKLLENRKLQDVLQNGILAILMLVVAGLFYLAELKVFEILTGVSTMNSTTYNGVGNVSQAFSGNVLGNVIDTYLNFVNSYKNFILTSYPEAISTIILGVIVLVVGMISLIGLNKIEWKNKLLFVILAAILPFAMNLTYFLSGGTAHVLTQYGVWMLFLLGVVLFMWIETENMSAGIKRVIYFALVFCTFIFITENIQTANTIYVKKDLEYQATLSYMTRVADRMEEQAEYVPGETSVMIIGENVIGISKTGFERYGVLTGVGGQGSVTYKDTYKDYFKYVLARPVSLHYDDELKNSEEVFEMPVYPKAGSIKMIDGVLVVKLAEN